MSSPSRTAPMLSSGWISFSCDKLLMFLLSSYFRQKYMRASPRDVYTIQFFYKPIHSNHINSLVESELANIVGGSIRRPKDIILYYPNDHRTLNAKLLEFIKIHSAWFWWIIANKEYSLSEPFEIFNGLYGSFNQGVSVPDHSIAIQQESVDLIKHSSKKFDPNSSKQCVTEMQWNRKNYQFRKNI